MSNTSSLANISLSENYFSNIFFNMCTHFLRKLIVKLKRHLSNKWILNVELFTNHSFAFPMFMHCLALIPVTCGPEQNIKADRTSYCTDSQAGHVGFYKLWHWHFSRTFWKSIKMNGYFFIWRLAVDINFWQTYIKI